jgi:hypothetical protein
MDFTERLANAWRLFTTSLSFIHRDKSLLIVPAILVASAIAFSVGFVLLLLARQALSPAWLVANLLIFLFVMYVWVTFFSSAQSWMVREVAEGKNTTFASGLKRALKNIPDIVAYAFVMLTVKVVSAMLRRKGAVGRAAGGVLAVLAGVAGKLVLPAMIVTERTFLQSIEQLSHTTKVIPEIAAFEIGIRPLTWLSIFVSLAISAAFAASFGFLAGLIIAVFLLLTVTTLVVLVDQIFYTLLYLALVEKKHVQGLRLAH